MAWAPSSITSIWVLIPALASACFVSATASGSSSTIKIGLVRGVVTGCCYSKGSRLERCNEGALSRLLQVPASETTGGHNRRQRHGRRFQDFPSRCASRLAYEDPSRGFFGRASARPSTACDSQ